MELKDVISILSRIRRFGVERIQGHRVASTTPTAAQILTWNDSLKQWEPAAAGTPGAHVLATTAGLGASHTTSGLTAGQVLRATAATTAAFAALEDADIPATIARDSEVTAEIATHTGDATDAHDASAISILDTAADFTATDVEGALAELQSDNEAHVVAADPHTGYILESLLDATGDLIIASAADTPARLASGADGTVLTGTGVGAAPAWEDGTGHTHAGSGTHDVLGSTVHTDTLTGTVVAGDIIYGNATPKWARLPKGTAAQVLTMNAGATAPEWAAAAGGAVATDAIWDTKGDLAVGTGANTAAALAAGAANTVLQPLSTEATGLIWRAAPIIVNIADTGATNRITTGTASPHVTLTGSTQITVNAGIGVAPSTLIALNVTAAATHSTALSIAGTQTPTGSLAGIKLLNTMQAGSATTPLILGFQGSALVNVNAKTITNEAALFFALATRTGPTSGTHAVTNLDLILLRATFDDTDGLGETLTITRFSGLVVDALTQVDGWGTGWLLNVTNTYGIYLKDLSTSNTAGTQTNVYGMRIDAIAAGTNRYGLSMGTVAGGTIAYLLDLGTGPTMRLKDVGTGGWTAAANETPLFIAQGATPTLRQMKTRVWDATAGHGFTNGDLVCYLV